MTESKAGSSHHLSILTAEVLEFFFHALQRLQEVIIFLRQTLIFLKHGLHLALCLAHPLQLNRGRKQAEERL